MPAFYIIQELKIGDWIINLEDKLCNPEATTLAIDKKIFKKIHVQLLFLLHCTNQPMMSTLEYAIHSSCEVLKRLGSADYAVYKIPLIISCRVERSFLGGC